MVRTENALVNLTSPGTFETIDATEGDNINIACFAFDSLYYFVYFKLIIQKGLVLRMLSPSSHQRTSSRRYLSGSMYFGNIV
ncbi:hypothetical protein Avbf_16834 [Armadillidium vulgare]|nr:hypothetical protein Avbf_16834 [Armadillidium vulgare]